MGLTSPSCGEGVRNLPATAISRGHPSLRDATRLSLFRLRPFFEAHRDDENDSRLARQRLWICHPTVGGRWRFRARDAATVPMLQTPGDVFCNVDASTP